MADAGAHEEARHSRATARIGPASLLAQTPEPPYYAVVFTSVRAGNDADGYGAMAERMVELAAIQPGFLGVESVRGADGVGITVSYWESLEAIRNWRLHAEHRVAQSQGRAGWYAEYRLRVCRVEREAYHRLGD